jgi:hypothetical protein
MQHGGAACCVERCVRTWRHQASAVQCSAVQCSAVQCSAVQCSAVRAARGGGRPVPLVLLPPPGHQTRDNVRGQFHAKYCILRVRQLYSLWWQCSLKRWQQARRFRRRRPVQWPPPDVPICVERCGPDWAMLGRAICKLTSWLSQYY